MRTWEETAKSCLDKLDLIIEQINDINDKFGEKTFQETLDEVAEEIE